MNSQGTSTNLVAAHPGNTNAVTHGIYSETLISARAAEIEDELHRESAFSPAQRLTVSALARCTATLEAIERVIDAFGVSSTKGVPSPFLDHWLRVSRRHDQLLSQLSCTMDRQWMTHQPLPALETNAYIEELQRIALGQDTTASARERITANKELRERGESTRGSNQVVTIMFRPEDVGLTMDETDNDKRDHRKPTARRSSRTKEPTATAKSSKGTKCRGGG